MEAMRFILALSFACAVSMGATATRILTKGSKP